MRVVALASCIALWTSGLATLQAQGIGGIVGPARGGRTNQGDPPGAELARAQRELEQNQAVLDRLLDLRLRHDLGLSAGGVADEVGVGTSIASGGLDRARQLLREEEQATADLSARYEKMRQMVEQLRAEATARALRQRQQEEWITVPTAGVASRQAVLPAAPAGEGRRGPSGGADGAEDQVPVSVVQRNLLPVKQVVEGSDDHSLVAQALFKAAQAMVDRAALLRAQGQAAAALQLDQEAKATLQRAGDELKPLLGEAAPPFPALFLLGRCREQLFRLDERLEGLSPRRDAREFQRREQDVREPFLQIAARDVERRGDRQTAEVLGLWGRAAQSAMEHFRWMNLNGGFQPRTALESIQWSNPQDR